MNNKLSVIVPYRDREEHLKEFLPYIGEYLKDISHEVIIIEQRDNKSFNRGKLLNVGYTVSNSEYICLHDVDLLPENADYSYVGGVKLLAVYREHNDYAPKWELGGVTLFNATAFKNINGYSNKYWCWGAEDSDLRYRCEKNKTLIERDFKGGRFKSLFHELNGDGKTGGLSEGSKKNRERYRYLIKHGVYPEGLNTKEEGLNTLEYKVVEYLDCGDYKYYGVEL